MSFIPKKQNVRQLLLFLLFASFATFSGCKKKADSSKKLSNQTPVIRVTGIPDENPTSLQRKNKPLVDYLRQQLKTNVTYVPVTDYGAAVQALIAGKIDFAWLGGFTHVQARNFAKVEPLVMRKLDRTFQSVFIAHVKSKIRSMKDLKGAIFAFGSKSSTSGHLMPRYYLNSQWKIKPERDFKGKPIYSGAHDATAKMVELGKVQAGVLNREVWKRMVKKKQVDTSQIRVIWITPTYVDYVWTARKSLPKALKKKFVQAFLQLKRSNPMHNKILQLQGAKLFVRAHTKDFDMLEKVARQTGLLRK